MRNYTGEQRKAIEDRKNVTKAPPIICNMIYYENHQKLEKISQNLSSDAVNIWPVSLRRQGNETQIRYSPTFQSGPIIKRFIYA